MRDRPIRKMTTGGKLRATMKPRTVRLENLSAGESIPEDYERRPKTRGECPAKRPCPWISCRYHLYLDVNPDTGAIKFNFPGLEVWELKETCALDVADRGGLTLDEVGVFMNQTRERVRQVEADSLAGVRVGLKSAPPRPRPKRFDPIVTVNPRNKVKTMTEPQADPGKLSLAKRIRQARKQEGLSRLELAGMVGVSDQTVALWEVGRHSPRPYAMDALSIALPTLGAPKSTSVKSRLEIQAERKGEKEEQRRRGMAILKLARQTMTTRDLSELLGCAVSTVCRMVDGRYLLKPAWEAVLLERFPDAQEPVETALEPAMDEERERSFLIDCLWRAVDVLGVSRGEYLERMESIRLEMPLAGERANRVEFERRAWRDKMRSEEEEDNGGT